MKALRYTWDLVRAAFSGAFFFFFIGLVCAGCMPYVGSQGEADMIMTFLGGALIVGAVIGILMEIFDR